jgi:hypothetical protein
VASGRSGQRRGEMAAPAGLGGQLALFAVDIGAPIVL